jgi:hypothetical protein
LESLARTLETNDGDAVVRQRTTGLADTLKGLATRLQ